MQIYVIWNRLSRLKHSKVKQPANYNKTRVNTTCYTVHTRCSCVWNCWHIPYLNVMNWDEQIFGIVVFKSFVTAMFAFVNVYSKQLFQSLCFLLSTMIIMMVTALTISLKLLLSTNDIKHWYSRASIDMISISYYRQINIFRCYDIVL